MCVMVIMTVMIVLMNRLTADSHVHPDNGTLSNLKNHLCALAVRCFQRRTNVMVITTAATAVTRCVTCTQHSVRELRKENALFVMEVDLNTLDHITDQITTTALENGAPGGHIHLMPRMEDLKHVYLC